MQLPKIFQGESLTRLIQGAVAGFLATVVIGFGWGGWTLGSTAMKMANQSANSAVVTALAPICVDNFQHAAEAKDTSPVSPNRAFAFGAARSTLPYA
jgi:ABC-type nitrate/sulfonate/bicarbonate transport system permease component